MPGHHHPVDRLRRLRHRAGPRRGPQEGPDRPLPLAADVALRGAGRAHARRRRDERALARHPRQRRPDRRLRLQRRPRRGRRSASCCCCCSATRSRGSSRSSACSSPRRRRPTRSASSSIFPLTFVSSAFVPVDTMPAACRRSPRSTRSRSSSTRCARCGSARRRATRSGARSLDDRLIVPLRAARGLALPAGVDRLIRRCRAPATGRAASRAGAAGRSPAPRAGSSRPR